MQRSGTAAQQPATLCQHYRVIRTYPARFHLQQQQRFLISHFNPQAPVRSPRQLSRRVQAYGRSLPPGHNDSAYNRSPVVDTTAEEVSTSGRGSDDSQDPHNRPSILRRAVTAALGLLSAALNWLKSNALLRRVFNRRILLYIVYSLLGFIFMTTLRVGVNSVTAKPPQEVMYSDFLTLVHSGNVHTAGIDDATDKIYFSLKGHSSHQATEVVPVAAAAPAAPVHANSEDADVMVRGAAARPRTFFTRAITDPGLIPLLIARGVSFRAVQATITESLTRMLVGTCALWLPLLPLFWFMRRALNSRTNTKPKKQGDSKSKPITFADVAGVDTAKEELLEVVACLRDATRYSKLNAKAPSGVLLTGPPGTGKTLLAKAVAGEAGVPFFAASASEFVELFVGRGAARVRELFAEARKRAPCVVFIDELDAVGPPASLVDMTLSRQAGKMLSIAQGEKTQFLNQLRTQRQPSYPCFPPHAMLFCRQEAQDRGSRRGIGVNEERDQTLNQLLTELDGFEGREGVLLLAATNRSEVLDPALTRPGRLSRKVVVPLPDEGGRADILGVHLRPTPMLSPADKEFCRNQIARITRGFSGAELANVVNEAALLAGRQGLDYVTLSQLVEAVQRTRYGVNGGSSLLAPTQGLQRRVTDWLLKRLSSNQQVKAQPVGH